MARLVRAFFTILARIFLSAMFLVSGANQIIYWKEAEKKFLQVVADWQTFTASSDWSQALFAAMAIWAPLILMVITFLQILGALFVLFGVKEKTGAVLLILVLVFMTVLVQHFWFSDGGQKEIRLAFFMRDTSILGGLIVVAIRGVKAGKNHEEHYSQMD